jgi:cysteine sulfinate desulfinase/cysteine desulfurase-like protein
MIFLDHNATVPVLPEVREAMLPFLSEEWGNPSSSYRLGSRLKTKIEVAREQVAELIGVKLPSEILFTSGGTESNNTAIHAAILSRRTNGTSSPPASSIPPSSPTAVFWKSTTATRSPTCPWTVKA